MDKLKRLLAEGGMDSDVLERATEKQLTRLVIPYLRLLDKELASS